MLKQHFGEFRWPGMDRRELQPWARQLNRVFRKLRLPVVLARPFDYRVDMLSREQAANLQLLIGAAVDATRDGDLVELGCYVGCTSAIIAGALAPMEQQRAFHVFDLFTVKLGGKGDIRSAFERNFEVLRLPLPVIHAGDILATAPGELPERIAFAHIDLGVGGDPSLQHRLITHALGAVYPRLVPGAIVVVMDYHIPGITVAGYDANPGTRQACDAFLGDKPERMSTLYGGPCSHGFFQKT